MAILSFKKRFAGKVRNGRKRQTIRALRKHPIVPGETLYLYTALRTKYAKKLREVKCVNVCTIHIYFHAPKIVTIEQDNGSEVTYYTTPTELNLFAKSDGFKDWEDMKAFWLQEHGIKKGNAKILFSQFEGILITW